MGRSPSSKTLVHKTHKMKLQACIFIISAVCFNWLFAINFDFVNYLPIDRTVSTVIRRNFTQLASEAGYANEEYEVITEDGYVLKLFRIPGNESKPVLLQHGLLDSADTFLLRGRKSLASELLEKGYDVWFGTSRGTRYGRKHIALDPDKNLAFWNYSMHEMGHYDLPAVIDFILHNNDQKQLSAVAHSQGNTLFYILGSTRPEYNVKIKALVALGPVCFLNHIKKALQVLIGLSDLLSDLLLSLNREEVLGDDSVELNFIHAVCRRGGYYICGKALFLLGGTDPKEFESEFFSTAIEYYPTGTSRKNLIHLSQVAKRNKFSRFDYGVDKNVKLYNSSKPCDYDLNKVNMRVALFVGKNDYVSTVEDVRRLYKMLPNAEYRELERERANHIDLVWGRTMNKYLSPHVLKVLEDYS